jgi:hypothetical protein
VNMLVVGACRREFCTSLNLICSHMFSVFLLLKVSVLILLKGADTVEGKGADRFWRKINHCC